MRLESFLGLAAILQGLVVVSDCSGPLPGSSVTAAFPQVDQGPRAAGAAEDPQK